MNRIEKAVLIGFIITLVLSLCGFADTCEDIEDSVLRLHIVANSDSQNDQRIKLAVRDRLLCDMPYLFDAAPDRDGAKQAALRSISEIEATVNDELKKQNAGYGCSVKLIDGMYFETREYDGFTMPAGFYCALCVTLGEAGGRNWWCVMYPPLCGSSAIDVDDAFKADSARTLKNGSRYEVKFKIYEFFCSLRDKIGTVFG